MPAGRRATAAALVEDLGEVTRGPLSAGPSPEARQCGRQLLARCAEARACTQQSESPAQSSSQVSVC
jgi:hypothetical protein